MSEFHVTCVYLNKPGDEKKKILTLKDKQEYKEKIQSLFNLPADGKYRTQKYNKKFDDWVDVDKWHELPDRGKLKLIVRSGLIFYLLFVV